MGKAELVVDAKANLGEGPVWDEKEQCLYWVNITEPSIHRYDPATGADSKVLTDQFVGAAVRRESGGFIAAMKDGIYILNEQGKRLKFLGDPESDLPQNRFNDGKCDRLGRFWAGTMSMNGGKKMGALYRVDPDGAITKVLEDISLSNGLAWSPDWQLFYYIDTPTKEVWAFDYSEEEGRLSNQRVVYSFKEGDGVPDGMTIDAEGMLWVAHWGGYKVSRIDPHQGVVLEEIRVPAKQVTSCTFGGSNLDELYITTARGGLDADELNQYPHAGGVFRVKLAVRGIRSYSFKG